MTHRNGRRKFTWRGVQRMWRLVKQLLPALWAGLVGYLVKRLFE